MNSGILITAPTSGAGKTTLTLGLMRALARRGVAFQPAKSGPDYIDPGFHHAAAGCDSINLDAWAMTPDRLRTLGQTGAPLVVEGAMGLFDGAGLAGRGSAADLAEVLNLGYILVIDCAKAAHSVAALVSGFVNHRPTLKCLGVILNRVGSDRHGAMIRDSLERAGGPRVLGAIPRDPKLALPERHLGLVLAQEHANLDQFINYAADVVETHVDLTAIELRKASETASVLPPFDLPAQTIAVAKDPAFCFAYPHQLNGWHQLGGNLRLFSPLNDDAIPDADFVFLPGGYPELYAGRLAGNETFLSSLRKHAQTKPVYGECGGYMILGEGLVDADGARHEMAGLLPLETSFAQRKLHLGYRTLTAQGGPFQGTYKAHEFHYASTLRADGPALFKASDADDVPLPDMGLRLGQVCGSFAHIIDGF